MFLRHFSAPEHVVSYEQSAFAQLGKSQAKHTWIVFLIYVVKNHVKMVFFFRQQFESVPSLYGNAVAYFGALEVAAGLLRILGITIGVDHFAVFANGSGPTDSGIADGRSPLKNCIRYAALGEMVFGSAHNPVQHMDVDV